MSVVALVIAPSIAISADDVSAYNKDKNTTEIEQVLTSNDLHGESVNKNLKVLVKEENGEKNATIITTTEVNGKKDVKVETAQGDEVDHLIQKYEE